ncbi:sigma-70 family RNA polymerase sigma factor [Marinigracilibium pacificum]|uniref:RNA polymerase sigma factor RpoD/SigA n=1 Tax=Marinigracilibium pacificum TaxID=2729599 RepID=A0A848J024_9BACT|nr:RNA polymerase sigma factor RpoD/SigA [Marinigracilibium pacificum]NMM50143.1 RNA polymerase sigma factor RpoD/SigA [Marinigracilibium pacificum]
MRQLKITQTITNRDSKTLEKYFFEISKEEMLTPEEEVMLAQRIKQGDQVALAKLIKANLRFVVSVAKQYQHTKIPLNDLINEGNVGLIKAAKKFDETRGFKFISYAVWWIRQSIIQALAEQSRMIRLPANKIGTLSKIDQAAAELQQKFDREPTPEELATVLEMDVDQVQDTLKSLTKSVSMDKPFEEGESSSLLDVLENEDANQVDSDLIHQDSLKSEVERVLSILSEKEREVIRQFFGIGRQQSLTLEDIGENLGLSRERVRQIKEKAIRKLSKSPAARNLIAYLGR